MSRMKRSKIWKNCFFPCFQVYLLVEKLFIITSDFLPVPCVCIMVVS